MAIINGEVVQKGDRLQDAVIVEIGDDYVTLQYNGQMITEKVAATKKARKKPAPASPPPESYQQKQYFQQKSRGQTQMNLSKVDHYANQAAYQERRYTTSVGNYKKVLGFLKKAEQEAQYALQRNLNNAADRDRIKRTIASIRQDMEAVKHRKKQLAEMIRDAIRQDRLVRGMTKSDVRRVLGSPTKKKKMTGSSYRAEEWYYKKEYPNKPEHRVYFSEDGIFVKGH